MPDPSPAKHYSPALTFRLAAGLFAALTTWLIWRVWQQPDVLAAIMCAGAIVITAGMIVGSLAHAIFQNDVLTYRVPFRPWRRIAKNRIVRVELAGRWSRGLVIEYRPEPSTDLGQRHTLFANLTPLTRQDELLALLGGHNEHDD